LPDEEARNYPLADASKLGQVELFVFRQSRDGEARSKSKDYSLRSEVAQAADAREAKAAVMRSMSIRKRGLVIPGQQEEAANVPLYEFNTGDPVGHAVITYFQAAARK